VTVEDIKKDVPWDLKIAESVTETPRPTDEEIDFIRHFAPGESAGKKTMVELLLTNLFKQAGQRV
jgi:glutaconate CoA-transferase subunit B